MLLWPSSLVVLRMVFLKMTDAIILAPLVLAELVSAQTRDIKNLDCQNVVNKATYSIGLLVLSDLVFRSSSFVLV